MNTNTDLNFRVDGIDEAGQIGCDTNDERNYCSPVDKNGVVAVDTVWSVEVKGVVLGFVKDPEVEEHDRSAKHAMSSAHFLILGK